MDIFTFALYILASAFALLVIGAIVPNPFRQKIRDTISIFLGKTLDNASSEIDRAELRVNKLAAETKENERKASLLRGSLNHEKNQLVKLKDELKQAEADYELAVADKLGEAVEADCLDKVGLAEEAVAQQEVAVADIEKSVDAVRLAVAKAARELKSLQNKVKTASVRSKATAAISSAADTLETSKDIAKATGELGRDLDKLDEQYEQAKTRFEDSQGSEAERKLEEAKQKRQRDEIKKRLEERKNKS